MMRGHGEYVPLFSRERHEDINDAEDEDDSEESVAAPIKSTMVYTYGAMASCAPPDTADTTAKASGSHHCLLGDSEPCDDGPDGKAAAGANDYPTSRTHMWRCCLWLDQPGLRKYWGLFAGSFALFVVGVLLLSVGISRVASPDMDAGGTAVVFIAGALFFIPGAHNVVYIVLALNGLCGLKLDYIGYILPQELK